MFKNVLHVSNEQCPRTLFEHYKRKGKKNVKKEGFKISKKSEENRETERKKREKKVKIKKGLTNRKARAIIQIEKGVPMTVASE